MQRSFVVNPLREIAARSRQRFDEGGSAQLAKIRQRVVALMAQWSMRTIAIVQEEIFAADRSHAGLFEDFPVKYLSEASVEAVALFCGYHEQRPAPKCRDFVR